MPALDLTSPGRDEVLHLAEAVQFEPEATPEPSQTDGPQDILEPRAPIDVQDPQASLMIAIQQASRELEHMDAGPEKMTAVMARAERIMRAQGWSSGSTTPKPADDNP